MQLYCFTQHDWSRSYALPAEVASTIPRTGSVGMYGSHNAALGLLVEVCRYTGGRPIELDYAERELGGSADLAEVVVTATVDVDQHGRVRVITCRRVNIYSEVGESWTLTVGGVHLAEEDRPRPPSPPLQGAIVARHLAEQRWSRP